MMNLVQALSFALLFGSFIIFIGAIAFTEFKMEEKHNDLEERLARAVRGLIKEIAREEVKNGRGSSTQRKLSAKTKNRR